MTIIQIRRTIASIHSETMREQESNHAEACALVEQLKLGIDQRSAGSAAMAIDEHSFRWNRAAEEDYEHAY